MPTYCVGLLKVTWGVSSVEWPTFPKSLHGSEVPIDIADAPAVGLWRVNTYGNDGSAQCGDHCVKMSGGATPGRKLTVTVAACPFPVTLDGMVPPTGVAIVGVSETV